MAVINPAHQMLKLDKFQTLVSDVYRGGGLQREVKRMFFRGSSTLFLSFYFESNNRTIIETFMDTFIDFKYFFSYFKKNLNGWIGSRCNARKVNCSCVYSVVHIETSSLRAEFLFSILRG